MQATAVAHPNIALVKYWGKRDVALNLPAVPSLSLTLDTFSTTTTVRWGAPADSFQLNGEPQDGKALAKLAKFLDLIDPQRPPCAVVSRNNFPTAAGLASSSSAFAALALAATAAAGQERSRSDLSALARRGSGSACRSLWGGWVQWDRGEAADGGDSRGRPIAPADHWDVRLVVAVVESGPKAVSSREGMIRTQETSPLFPAFVATADADVAQAADAVARRDLAALGAAMERSTMKMHATMLAADPCIRYWKPGTLAVLDAVDALRARGVAAYCTQDAGPNVKVLCEAKDAGAVAAALEPLAAEVGVLGVGGDARLVD